MWVDALYENNPLAQKFEGRSQNSIERNKEENIEMK